MTAPQPSISEIQTEIVHEFSQLRDWDSRYAKIIELGRSLPKFPEAARTDDNKVKGCQSQVWLVARLDESGAEPCVHFDADSDAMIVRGLIALLMRVYNNQPPAAILANKPTFLDDIELTKNLSMQRNNGLAAVLKQVQAYALGFQYKLGLL